ncbi:MAG: tRNA lysidine(34) synthetase TilS [Isosphaeraceae bacterium]
MNWIDRISHRIARWRARGLGDTWVVGVSGGGDSVGLLRVLHQLAPAAGLRLWVAHLDHGVRGEASRADAAFVAELAESLGLPFDLGQWRPIRTGHFESEARRARYEWLAEIARARNAQVVAVGHTRDDQAETILHRIVRGTGPRGLIGIPTRRVLATEPPISLVRPLLEVSRRDLRAYLEGLGQPCREDESNADLSRTRARIRHDLMPKLAAEYNPKLVDALVRLGELTAASHHTIEADAREMAKAAIITQSADCVVLKPGLLSAAPAFLRAEVLRRIWRIAGWPEGGMSARRWQRMAALARAREVPRVAIGAGVTMATESYFLVLRRSQPASTVAPPIQPIALTVPGSASVPWAGCRVEATSPGDGSFDESVDFDQVALPLSIRAPLLGDRFEPLGMGGRSMPLADFFRGRHVPPERRSDIPLVCDQVGIIWVVGHRIADRVKVTGKTRNRLGLRWLMAPS